MIVVCPLGDVLLMACSLVACSLVGYCGQCRLVNCIMCNMDARLSSSERWAGFMGSHRPAQNARYGSIVGVGAVVWQRQRGLRLHRRLDRAVNAYG